MFEFLIPRRPVSLQAKRTNLQKWKEFVRAEASKTWIGTPYKKEDLHLTLIYLCDNRPVDTDNIIKPIQDALIKLIYDDDLLITDVESHRRSFLDAFDITEYPSLLIDGIRLRSECVYVRITESKPLENYL